MIDVSMREIVGGRKTSLEAEGEKDLYYILSAQKAVTSVKGHEAGLA